VDSVLARPKRLVTLRRDGDDFVVAFYPEDLVVFRHNEAEPLRKMCAFLFSEKWHGAVPQSDIDVEGEIRKMHKAGPGDGWSTGGATRARTEPRTLQSLDDDAVKAEMFSAPWLTIEEAVARVEAARRAAQQVADRNAG
jgi:hypothetical protein